MTRLTAIILSILTAISITGMAQTNNSVATDGLANGGYWTSAIDEEKDAYVIGYSDHFFTTHELSMNSNNLKEDFIYEDAAMPKLSVNRIVAWLNRFYADPANVNITIHSGIVILCAEVMGKSAADLKKMTERLRIVANRKHAQ